MYMYTHIYIHVYRLVKRLCTSKPSAGRGFCTRKRRLPEGISGSSAGGGTKQDRSGLSEVCMYMYTHIYTYMYIGLYIKTLPWMCQLLVWRMVPIRRARCINNLSVEFTSKPSAGTVLYKKSAGSGGYLRQQCGWGVETRPVRALGSVHVYVHTHIQI